MGKKRPDAVDDEGLWDEMDGHLPIADEGERERVAFEVAQQPVRERITRRDCRRVASGKGRPHSAERTARTGQS